MHIHVCKQFIEALQENKAKDHIRLFFSMPKYMYSTYSVLVVAA